MSFSFVKIERPKAPGHPSRVSSATFFLLCLLPCLATVLFGAVDNITWAILTILVGTIILLWLIEGWITGAFPFNSDSLYVPLAALLVLGIIQLLPLGQPLPLGLLTLPARETLSLDPYATRTFVRNLAIFLLFLAGCLTFINTAERVRKAALVGVVFGAVMAFYGILQHIANTDSIYGLRKPFQANPFGPFVNQHHFAAFMEMTAGVTLGMIFGSSAKEKKFLFGLAAIVMLAAIILTSSRGGMLSICATAGFAALLSFLYRTRYDGAALESGQNRSKLPVIVGGLGIATTVILLVLFLGGDDSLTRGIGLTGIGDDLSNGRLHFWSVAIKIFLDHPIIGAGLDAFGVAFTRHDTWNGTFRVEQAHNDYLQILADAGLLGLACVIGFVYLLFKKGLKTISSAGTGMRRDIAIGSLAGCFGILIHSFVDFPLRTWSNSFFFLLLVTCATVSVKSVSETATRRKRRST